MTRSGEVKIRHIYAMTKYTVLTQIDQNRSSIHLHTRPSHPWHLSNCEANHWKVYVSIRLGAQLLNCDDHEIANAWGVVNIALAGDIANLER